MAKFLRDWCCESEEDQRFPDRNSKQDKRLPPKNLYGFDFIFFLHTLINVSFVQANVWQFLCQCL